MPIVDIFILVGAWILYGAVHSALIAPGVTRWMQRHLGSGYRFYRIGFNITAVVTLVPVIWVSNALVDRGGVWWAWTGPWQGVRWGIALVGMVFFISGAKQYDLGHFFGVPTRWRSDACAAMGDACRFSATGILAWVRHPWYAGAMVVVWARPLDTAVLVTNAVIIAYVVIGTLLEERKLVARFGDDYRNYQRQVPMFFPYRPPQRNRSR